MSIANVLCYGLLGGLHGGLYDELNSVPIAELYDGLNGGLLCELFVRLRDGLDDGLFYGLNDAIRTALQTKSENQS